MSPIFPLKLPLSNFTYKINKLIITIQVYPINICKSLTQYISTVYIFIHSMHMFYYEADNVPHRISLNQYYF